MLHHATPLVLFKCNSIPVIERLIPAPATKFQNHTGPINYLDLDRRPVEHPLHLPPFCLDEIKVHVFPLKIAYLAAPKLLLAEPVSGTPTT